MRRAKVMKLAVKAKEEQKKGL